MPVTSTLGSAPDVPSTKSVECGGLIFDYSASPPTMGSSGCLTICVVTEIERGPARLTGIRCSAYSGYYTTQT